MTEPCTGCQDISEKLTALKDLLTLKVVALEALTNERFVSAAQALILQSAETARRLDALNGEAGRLLAMQATYLPREVFDSTIATFREKLDDLRRSRDEGAGRQSALVFIVSGVFSFLSFIASRFFGR